MATIEKNDIIQPTNGDDSESIDLKSLDSDAAKLEAMGYTQDMRRNFSVWSILGIGFALTNSWFGISASMIVGIYSGGPLTIVYGIILIACISTCVGISLSEMASAMPNAGGQYYWANELAPKKYANVLAYYTGFISWAASIFTSASVAVAIGSALMGVIQIAHPQIIIQRWMVFIAYQVFNFTAFLFNCYGRVLPTVATVALYTSLLSFLVITITVAARSPNRQPAHFVFKDFVNETGWSSGGIAFIMGLINSNWSFACLDSATHLAEEVAQPERMIPIAIMGTVAIGFTTAFCFVISMFFSAGDLAELTGTPTGVPILALFYQALRGNTGAAIFLEVLIILTGLGCQIACHTWQARLCWSFARDRGLPGSHLWAKIHPKLEVPINAHMMSCAWVGALGALYVGSTTAFNSMITACIVLLYLSYAIPLVCLLIKGRNNIPHGPFWLGPFGLVANIVTLCWTLFTLVMYSFPYVYPATAGTMNYVSAVYFVVFSLGTGYWFVRGRRTFRTRDERHIIAEQQYRRHSVAPVEGAQPLVSGA